MKIIKPSVEFFGAVPTEYNAALKFIEMAGRTCYKSEDKITENSAEGFVRKLIRAKPYPHMAMVEHSNFVIKCHASNLPISLLPLKGEIGKYLNAVFKIPYVYIGGNLTAWYQRIINNSPDPIFDSFYEVYSDLFELTLPEGGCGQWEVCPHNEIPHELHRYSARVICDRGVSHELVRHRPCSFAQESTRYVNYAGKDMEFIEPWWWETEQSNYLKSIFVSSCDISERIYKDFITYERTPQQARAILPNTLKTEIIVTADAAEWEHIKNLRTAKAAHLDMQRVMNMMPWESFL